MTSSYIYIDRGIEWDLPAVAIESISLICLCHGYIAFGFSLSACCSKSAFCRIAWLGLASDTELWTAAWWSPQESVAGKRHFPATQLFDVAVFFFFFSFVAAQLLVQMTSVLQKSECCSAVSAAQLSKNCSATSVFACGRLGVGFRGVVSRICWSICVNPHPCSSGLGHTGCDMRATTRPSQRQPPPRIPRYGFWLGQRSCSMKVPRIFRILSRTLPRILLRIFLDFSRSFRASFGGRQRPEKFTKNPHHFSMQNSEANSKKKIHKSFLESRQISSGVSQSEEIRCDT